MPGDIVFSVGALIMGWDFLMKLRKTSAAAGDGTAEAAPAN
jgi:hypothetical protein